MADPKTECPMCVISLDHAQARRDTSSVRLKALRVACEFSEGVDGRKLDILTHPNYEPVKRRLFYGRDVSDGEFGCVLAHRKVCRRMIDNRIPRALVLEDDASLADELPAVIAALGRMSDHWDLLCFLDHPKNCRSARSMMPLEGTGSRLSRPYGIPGGAYDYMMNLRAAERLWVMTENNWLAIDALHGVTWLTGLKTLSVIPSPALPNDDVPSCSDEQDNRERRDKTVRLSGWQRLCYPPIRGAWKLCLNAAVTTVWLSAWPADSCLARGGQRHG